MAFPKTHLFDPAEQKLSRIGRTLGHPARIHILNLLKKLGPQNVIEFEKRIPLTQGTITEHLRKLRVAGLIDVEERGLMCIYSINHDGLEQLFETHRLFEEAFKGMNHVAEVPSRGDAVNAVVV